MNFNTALLHTSSNEKHPLGSTLAPIFQVSAFSHESAEQLEKVFNNKAYGYAYTRISNPTVDSFEKKIAALEKGIGAVACSSGMSAITLALLNILESGDEVIAGAGLFGGTIDLFHDLEAFGITTRFVKYISKENIEPLITDKTKVVFGEIIGNPGLDIIDLKEVTTFLHSKGIPFVADATTSTPYLINAIDFGVDIIVHSSSKYINGSGNAISGVIVDSGNFKWDSSRYRGFKVYEKYGKFAYIAKLRNGIWRNIGGCLAPMNAFFNLIGIETLGLRMKQICDNALKLSEFFENDGRVLVNYPALKGNKYYSLVQTQLGGKGGGIITIRAGSKARAFALINSLKLATNATNIGDTRTLVIHAASTIYTHSSEEAKENAGVYDDTIRISVGIEDSEDLIADFKNALDSIKDVK